MFTLAQTTQSAWYDLSFANNPLWKWAALLGVLIATFVIGKIISFFLNRQGQWLIDRKTLAAVGGALRCLSGATVNTSPSSRNASLKAFNPSELMPSSFVVSIITSVNPENYIPELVNEEIR